MSDALITAILGELVKFVNEAAKQQVKLMTDVEKKIRTMEQNLKAIKAVLVDAEDKQFGNEALALWLDELKEAAFEIEDVLDDWNASLLKSRRDRSGRASSRVTEKVFSCFTPCVSSISKVVRSYDIAREIAEINDRLEDIARRKNNFGLTEKPEKNQPRRPMETTCFEDDRSKLYGRDGVKEDIIGYLLSGSREVETISVVGMGGIGNTALAQLVYHDSRVEQCFHQNRIWVCVSDYFEVKNVAKAIIGGLDCEGNLSNAFYSFSLQKLLQRIFISTRESKFLLVLDDVWEDDIKKWQGLLNALRSGSQGSRILLTTRKDTVVKMLESSHTLHLERLCDEDCWTIFRQPAFYGRSAEQCMDLENIGRGISDKCKGLPLAVKALGNVLKSKRSKGEWEEILNSEIWKLDIAEKEIFTPLLLSYYDLPSFVKQCFRFCVAYRKDIQYFQTYLVYNWMAHGYLMSEGISDLESRGADYFSFLLSRSLFQDIDYSHRANGPTSCKMHDIVHDLGKFLTKEEMVIKEVDSKKSSSINLSSRKTRHLTLHIAEGTYPCISVIGAKKLHTLNAPSSITTESLSAIFNEAKHLRMVELGWRSGSSVTNKSIPEEIGSLIHLKYLGLSSNDHRSMLPHSMGKLISLQYLNLSDNTALEELPDCIGELISLRFLRTVGCVRLSCYPKSIGRLTNLRQLAGVELGADKNDPTEFSLGDLANMNQLRLLWFKLKGDTVDAEEVRRAKFDEKSHLKDARIFLAGSLQSDDTIQALDLPPGIKPDFSSNGNTFAL